MEPQIIHFGHFTLRIGEIIEECELYFNDIPVNNVHYAEISIDPENKTPILKLEIRM